MKYNILLIISFGRDGGKVEINSTKLKHQNVDPIFKKPFDTIITHRFSLKSGNWRCQNFHHLNWSFSQSSRSQFSTVDE